MMGMVYFIVRVPRYLVLREPSIHQSSQQAWKTSAVGCLSSNFNSSRSSGDERHMCPGVHMKAFLLKKKHGSRRGRISHPPSTCRHNNRERAGTNHGLFQLAEGAFALARGGESGGHAAPDVAVGGRKCWERYSHRGERAAAILNLLFQGGSRGSKQTGTRMCLFQSLRRTHAAFILFSRIVFMMRAFDERGERKDYLPSRPFLSHTRPLVSGCCRAGQEAIL